MGMALGSRCAGCGAETDLTFDCLEPQGHTHHAWSAPQRISFYRKQMRAGNLQLLCSGCNSLKADASATVWLQVVCIAAAEEALQRPSGYPGRGPGLTPAARRDLIRKAISRLTHPF